MARFLCTGDLHLGAGSDLGRAPGDRLAEQEQLWQRIINLAAEREVDAILFAGDAFEGPVPSPEHYAAFGDPVRGADCRVIAITGNGKHDAAMRTTTAPQVIEASMFEIHTRPHLRRCSGTVVALLPWAPVSRLVAAAGGGDRDDLNVHAAELVLEVARGLRADAERDFPGMPAVLMTHFSISGAALPTGLPVDLLREPVLSLTGLEELGFDTIVAGHIHRHQFLSPRVFYVGSPMPLNFGEGGDLHGVTILDVAAGAPGAAEFVPLESRPFVTLDWDLDEVEPLLDLDPLRGHDFGIPKGAFVKLRYATPPSSPVTYDQATIVRVLEEAGAYRVWIDQTIERDDVVRGDTPVSEDLAPLDQLAAYLEHAGVNGHVGAAIVERTRANLEEVGS